MKVITLVFPDSADISNFPVEKTGVSITDGTNAVAGGAVLLAGTLANPPEATLVPHSHKVAVTGNGSTGPAVPA